MTLKFPNPSRSFDEQHNRILFWGYDSAIEVTFYVEAEALQILCPNMETIEKGCLLAFDDSREEIYQTADKVYTQGRKGTYSYILVAEDFS